MKKIIFIAIIVVLVGLASYFLSSKGYLGETLPQPPALPE